MMATNLYLNDDGDLEMDGYRPRLDATVRTPALLAISVPRNRWYGNPAQGSRLEADVLAVPRPPRQQEQVAAAAVQEALAGVPQLRGVEANAAFDGKGRLIVRVTSEDVSLEMAI
jgi:hypothetical protein